MYSRMDVNRFVIVWTTKFVHSTDVSMSSLNWFLSRRINRDVSVARSEAMVGESNKIGVSP